MTCEYSPQQLQHYFDYVGLPQRIRHEPPSVPLLKAIHIHTLSSIPYENLSLHYNAEHRIDLDPQHLFRKIIVHCRGRGGFCMEVAILYNHILRAIGFDAYTSGVRTRKRLEGVPEGDYPGCFQNHIVNIITFPDGSQYHSDVAFGGDGAKIPMPMIDGLVHQNLRTQQIRLIRDWIPHQVHKTNETKQWIYQYRNRPESDWNSFYSFPGIEFSALDWGVVNWWINSHPDSHQRFNVLVVKFLRRCKKSKTGGEACEESEIHGKRALINRVVKENLGGRARVVAECKTENERVDAFKEYFDLALTEEERNGIKGYNSEVR